MLRSPSLAGVRPAWTPSARDTTAMEDPVDLDVLDEAVFTCRGAAANGGDVHCNLHSTHGKEELCRHPVVADSDEDARLRACSRVVLAVYNGQRQVAVATKRPRSMMSAHEADVAQRCAGLLVALLLRGVAVEFANVFDLMFAYKALMRHASWSWKPGLRREFLAAAELEAVDMIFYRNRDPRTPPHCQVHFVGGPIRKQDLTTWSAWAHVHGCATAAGLADQTFVNTLGRDLALRPCAVELCQALLHFASTPEELCDLLTMPEVQDDFFLLETMQRTREEWVTLDREQRGVEPAVDATTHWRVAAWQAAILAVAAGPRTETSPFEWEAPEAACVEMFGLLPEHALRNARENIVSMGRGPAGGPMSVVRFEIPAGVETPLVGYMMDAGFNPFLGKAGRSRAPWILWYTTLAWATHHPESFPFADFGRAMDLDEPFVADERRGAYTRDGPQIPLDRDDFRRLTRREMLKRLWKLWTASVTRAATCIFRKPFATLERSREGVGWMASLYGMAKPTTPWQRAKFHWHLIWLWTTRIRPYAVFWAETAGAAVMARHEEAQRAVQAERPKDASMEGFDDAVAMKLAQEDDAKRARRRSRGDPSIPMEWRILLGETYHGMPDVLVLGMSSCLHKWRVEGYRRRRMGLKLLTKRRERWGFSRAFDDARRAAVQRACAYPKTVRLPTAARRGGA